MQEIIFLKCFDRQSANDTLEILSQGGIKARIQNNTENTFEKVYFGLSPQDAYWVLIPEDTMEKAQILLDEAMEKAANQWEGDHDFYHYSIRDLTDIVRNGKEWGIFEYTLAKRILEEKLMK
ncbi:MAG: hypothetical protein K1X92_05635 [Bacteroidia bacterium]|nr:hypothetical protein [Bacteroidia bacterium]